MTGLALIIATFSLALWIVSYKRLKKQAEIIVKNDDSITKLEETILTLRNRIRCLEERKR